MPHLRVEFIPDGFTLTQRIYYMIDLAISDADSLSFPNLVLQRLIHSLLIRLYLDIFIMLLFDAFLLFLMFYRIGAAQSES